MNGKEKSGMERITPDEPLNLGTKRRMMAAESAWTDARGVRQSALSRLRAIADLPLTHDQAKRSADQVAKLREELTAIEVELRKEAEELEGG